MLGAAKKHTNEGQGGGRNPGVERPDAGRGQSPAHSKILSCRNAGFLFLYMSRFILYVDYQYFLDLVYVLFFVLFHVLITQAVDIGLSV